MAHVLRKNEQARKKARSLNYLRAFAKWCRGSVTIRLPHPFQGRALPFELPRHKAQFRAGPPTVQHVRGITPRARPEGERAGGGKPRRPANAYCLGTDTF